MALDATKRFAANHILIEACWVLFFAAVGYIAENDSTGASVANAVTYSFGGFCLLLACAFVWNLARAPYLMLAALDETIAARAVERERRMEVADTKLFQQILEKFPSSVIEDLNWTDYSVGWAGGGTVDATLRWAKEEWKYPERQFLDEDLARLQSDLRLACEDLRNEMSFRCFYLHGEDPRIYGIAKERGERQQDEDYEVLKTKALAVMDKHRELFRLARNRLVM